MPIPCCSCYNALKEKKYLDYSQDLQKMYFKLSLLFSIAIMLIHVPLILFLNSLTWSIIITEIVFLGLFIVLLYRFLIKKIFDLRKGKQYYLETYEGKKQENQFCSRREEFLDADDKIPSLKGAYFSTGYEVP